MNKSMKILGVLLVLAITGLSVENALTGHGIKGNKNLNSEVLADGSGSDTNSTGTDTECTSSWPGDCIQTGNRLYERYFRETECHQSNFRKVGNAWCYDFESWSVSDCGPGDEECTDTGKLAYNSGTVCSSNPF